ncbi:MAG: YbhB/YbcL family Raf kinase inhibitor-like protein [Longimicrobiales bacterium]
MQITSSAFHDNEEIPRRYSREGAELSPPLAIEDVPDGTETLALIVDDPDAPNQTWVHWLIWNIPGDRSAIPEDVPEEETVSALGGAAQGLNDFDEIGYGGPMPPPGHGTHHYRFTVYALSEPLELEPGADRAELEDAMDGKILDQARITGTYERE